MAIDPDTIAAYAPHGNVQLAFEVGRAGGPLTPQIDSETGNYVFVPVRDATTGNYDEPTEVLEYLAAGRLEAPRWSPEFGVDNTSFIFRGRLLSPATLDPRIQTGAQAIATINGVRGRLELTFDVDKFNNAVFNNDTRQSILGTFRIVGGIE